MTFGGKEVRSLSPQQAFENGCGLKDIRSESHMHMVYFLVLTLGTNYFYRVFIHPLLKVKETFHEEREDEVSIAVIVTGIISPFA